MKNKILFSFGTRPEAIKLAPVIIEAQKSQYLDVRVVATAQHRQMLDQVLNAFSIVPDHDLNLMGHAQGLNEIFSKVVSSFDSVLNTEKPDWVVVHGDTTTTSASAVAAFHRGIQIAHVEAGLRTFNMKSPFPEEFNRQLVSKIADLHLAPTALAKQNLLNEKVAEEKILLVGNTVIDALQLVISKIQSSDQSLKELKEKFNFLNPRKKMILVTVHRRESFGQGIEDVCKAIFKLAETRGDIEFVIPVHLNPRVQEVVHGTLGSHPSIHLISPQEYVPFAFLMKTSHLILTDSGGIQEEAPALGKPVLVLREVTERPEAISAGCAKLVGTDPKLIEESVNLLLDHPELYSSMSQAKNPFGDGLSSRRIIDFFDKIGRNERD